MKAIPDGWAIVLVGNWNIPLFSPPWISGRLTEAKEIGIELAFNIPAFKPRFSFDDVYLTFSDKKLLLKPKVASDELMLRLETIAARILTDLPHTPVTGLGINFKFLVENPSGLILDLFKLKDFSNLSDAGVVIKQTNILRKLVIDGKILNLGILFQEGGTVLIDCNFHNGVKDATDAKDKLIGTTIPLKQIALGILKTTYDLE